ncbi:histidinol dehydrogenase [Algicella marina]|uniref:Histidinol dehydrogenase homolog n=1 Tax=Algicella marina TaxID=2683284 RepID=A0A6P1SZ71_9RHOB|nr:histidinol dehydrogenase [Algicella marina]QHQ35768.1 histidinol dehydrogenase [Algicella marina]
MAVIYLKKAKRTAATGEDQTAATVKKMLAEIETGGDTSALSYAERLDGFTGNPVVSRADIDAAAEEIPARLKSDIQYAYDRITSFARAQRASITEFETELSPGIWAGQKLIPMQSVGAYIPGGRYAHIASAIMSVATAREAGVGHITASSAPRANGLPHPAILYTAHLSGADTILALGGVQAVASMAFGLFGTPSANILVGPGNRFVAEAKRQLYGRTGIDLFAGPTEICIIADASSDPAIVAEDLVSQAEHGPDSPAWLITTSRELGTAVAARMTRHISTLPEPAKSAATAAWEDYGEIALCDTAEEAVSVSDSYAPEHLELHTQQNGWYTDKLKNYGSLFIGEETTVTYGDKCSGTNHILPTKGSGTYTGGLSVHKFLKIVTTQRMTREANRSLGQTAARISRLEGMEAHARAADIRLAKYFPEESFDTRPI